MFINTVAERPRSSAARYSLVSAAVAAAIAGSLPTIGQAQDAELTEITITGSRIVRRDLTASSPIVTVDAEVLENISTVGVESALNKMPQFKPAGTQFVAGDVQASAFNNPGISSLSLRGLGPNRNLVLVDGRRAQPANATLVVDVNSIPAAAISSVEIISGGASATYGADAIAGVVNFKLKKDFQGLVVDGQTGITQEGDGAESRISALIGGNFNDGKANVMAGIEFSKRSQVLQADRDFYVEGWEDPGTTGAGLTGYSAWNPGTTLPSQAAVNTVFGTTGTAVNRATNFFLNRDNTLFKQSPARRYNSNEDGVKLVTTNNTLSQPETAGLASSPLTRYSIFARGTFNLNDSTSAFVQGNLSSIHVSSILTYAPATSFWSAFIPRDATHPVPTELAALLDSRTKIVNGVTVSAANDPWQLERVLDFAGPRASTNDSDVYQVMAGLQGDLGLGDWTWEAYASHGETKITNYLNGGFVSVERWRKMVTAPNYGKNFTIGDPTGILGYKISCTSGMPIFESFTPSQDCLDGMASRLKNITNLKQDIAEANFQGGIVDLPAGQLRAAAGFTHRINTFRFDPDVLNDQESVIDGPIGLFAANDTNGRTRVNELYAEVLVPILKDLPAIKEFSLELGGRRSAYDTAGAIWTYKALANWGVNSFVNFRGGYQLANRAPNTAELFTGPTVTVAGFPNSDPCAINTLAPWGNVASNPNRAKVQALCSALNGTGTSVFDLDPNAFIGGNGGFFPLELENRRGNIDLESEEAHTITVGAVFRAPFESPALSNLTAAIDYYDIKISNAISPLPSTTVYENCFNANGSSNTAYSLDDAGGYCRLIKRDGVTGGRVSVDAPYFNLGSIETDGIDAQFNWRAALADMGMSSLPGSISAGLSVNYLLSYKTQSIPGAAFTDNDGTVAQNGQYEYNAALNLGYSLGAWNVGFNWRHLPSAKNAAAATNPATTLQGPGSYDVVDFSAAWSMSDTVAMRFGVDNLFDREPEIVGANAGLTNAKGATLPGYYDVLGRRMYLGVKLTF
jgi:outer membrane receptor protein involved in Fe transport